MRISDWSSDVCSSDLIGQRRDRIIDPADGAPIAAIDIDFDIRTASVGDAGRPATHKKPAVVADIDPALDRRPDRKSTSLELQSPMRHSYAVFCFKHKKNNKKLKTTTHNTK